MRMRWLLGLVAVSSLGLASCASHQTALALQSPPVANALTFSVPPTHPLAHTVVLDYISGMSQHSFWFAEANQKAFRPQVEKLLVESGMMAPTPVAARYGLQIEFVDLKGSVFGTDFDSRSRAIYRIVDRRTGRVAFSSTVDAGFSARFVGLNEDDAVLAYSVIGAPLVAASIASPSNYIASPNTFGRNARVRAHAREGDLATQGFGARDGLTRAKQADFQMMKQSLAKFVLALSTQQRIPMTKILPCLDNPDIDREKADLARRGMRWTEDNCELYPAKPAPIVY